MKIKKMFLIGAVLLGLNVTGYKLDNNVVMEQAFASEEYTTAELLSKYPNIMKQIEKRKAEINKQKSNTTTKKQNNNKVNTNKNVNNSSDLFKKYPNIMRQIEKQKANNQHKKQQQVQKPKKQTNGYNNVKLKPYSIQLDNGEVFSITNEATQSRINQYI